MMNAIGATPKRKFRMSMDEIMSQIIASFYDGCEERFLEAIYSMRDRENQMKRRFIVKAIDKTLNHYTEKLKNVV